MINCFKIERKTHEHNQFLVESTFLNPLFGEVCVNLGRVTNPRHLDIFLGFTKNGGHP